MKCKTCGSEHCADFSGELAIHFPGLENLSKPHVFIAAELAVCLQCGRAEFAIPNDKLRQLMDSSIRKEEINGRSKFAKAGNN